jgi:hypothetical protein
MLYRGVDELHDGLRGGLAGAEADHVPTEGR